MLVTNSHELLYDGIRGRRPVYEEQIIVLNSCINETLSVVLLLVQSNYTSHAKLLEYLHVLLGVVAVPLIGVSLLYGAHEGHELPRNDPVHVSILHSLIKLILLHIKSAEIVPLELNGVLQTLQALEQGAVVEAIALAGVSVGLEEVVVGSKHVPGLLSGALEDDYHKGTHEKGPIHHLVRFFRSAVVKNAVLTVVLVAQEAS